MWKFECVRQTDARNACMVGVRESKITPIYQAEFDHGEYKDGRKKWSQSMSSVCTLRHAVAMLLPEIFVMVLITLPLCCRQRCWRSRWRPQLRALALPPEVAGADVSHRSNECNYSARAFADASLSQKQGVAYSNIPPFGAPPTSCLITTEFRQKTWASLDGTNKK